MRRKITVFTATTLVLIAALSATAGMVQRVDKQQPEPPVPQVVDLNQIKEKVVRDMFDSTGRMIYSRRRG